MWIYAAPEGIGMSDGSELIWSGGCPPGATQDPILDSPTVQDGLR